MNFFEDTIPRDREDVNSATRGQLVFLFKVVLASCRLPVDADARSHS